MAYAATADVQALIGALFTIGAATTPSTSQVEAWLDQASAEVDGVLVARGYSTVPATGGNDTLILKSLVAQRVAAIVYHAAFNEDDAPANIKAWTSYWDDFMARLRAGSQRLVDQEPRSRAGVILAGRYTED